MQTTDINKMGVHELLTTELKQTEGGCMVPCIHPRLWLSRCPEPIYPPITIDDPVLYPI